MTAGFTAAARAQGLAAADKGDVLFIDTYKDTSFDMHEWKELNPFYCFDDAVLPVPGTTLRARSVESVWQGLKIVDGEKATGMFLATPWKRPPDNERTGEYNYSVSLFDLGGRHLDLVDARLLIYLPVYLHLIEALMPAASFDRLVQAPNTGVNVVFFDWDSNMNIRDSNSSFSHSAILAAYFGEQLETLLELNYEAAERHGVQKIGPLARYDSMRALRKAS